jgi:hypothetical protein
MTAAMGPQSFIIDFEAIATSFANKIVRVARMILDSKVLVDGAVDPGAQDLLRHKLLQAGFTSVEFHTGQRDGNYIEVAGNPYADGNIAQRAIKCVNEMNQLMKNAKMHDRRVIIDYRVPEPVQEAVRNAYCAPEIGWKNVEFLSGQKDGDSIILSV